MNVVRMFISNPPPCQPGACLNLGRGSSPLPEQRWRWEIASVPAGAFLPPHAGHPADELSEARRQTDRAAYRNV